MTKWTKSNMEKLIDDYLKEEISWNSFLNPYLFSSCNDSKEIAELIQFLTEKTNFIYHDTCSDMPFQSFLVFPDQKSINVNNLSFEDISVIQKVINHSKNPYLIGKMYDIIGCIRKDREAFLKCADCYYSIFSKSITSEHVQGHPLHRALYLYKKYDNSKMKTVYNELLKADYSTLDQKLTIIYYLVEFKEKTKLKLDKSDIQTIIEILKTHSRTDDCGLYLAKRALTSGLCTDTEKSFLRNKYADICEWFSSLSDYEYGYLLDAISFLDPVKDNNRINEFRFLVEQKQTNIYDSMTEHDIPMNEPFASLYYNYMQQFWENLKKAPNSIAKFLLLNKFCNIKSQNDSCVESSVFDFFHHCTFNSEKKVIFDSKLASESEHEEMGVAAEISEQIAFLVHLITAFYSKFHLDDSFCEIVDEIMSKNLLVPKSRVQDVEKWIKVGLSNIANVKEALYFLVSQFEFGCYSYIKEYKKIYPVINKNGRTFDINLNNILICKGNEKNPFRDCIAEILGNDLTTSLEYLLCRNSCGNIRNKQYHSGIESAKPYNDYELFAFVFIVRAYCMGYDESL